MVKRVQHPRHAVTRRVAAARTVLRGAVVAVLALPSVVGVGALVSTYHGARPHAPADRGGAAAAAAAAALAPAVSSSPAASPAPSPSHSRGTSRLPTSGIARSGLRLAQAARTAAGQVAAQRVSSVVGLGDSVPAGTNCGCTDYVDLLAQDIGTRQGMPVDSNDLAVPGQTSDGLLGQLDTTDVQQAVAGADVVVVTIGANDVETGTDPASCALAGTDVDSAAQACYHDELETLTPNLDRIAARIAALPTAPGARVLVTGYWNVFLDGAPGRAHGDTYARIADAITKVVNARIGAAAAAHGATFVDLFPAFRGGDGSRDATPLLADDGDHPNAEGHRVIEKALAAAL